MNEPASVMITVYDASGAATSAVVPLDTERPASPVFAPSLCDPVDDLMATAARVALHGDDNEQMSLPAYAARLTPFARALMAADQARGDAGKLHNPNCRCVVLPPREKAGTKE